MDYRFNPNMPHPDWYSPVDPKATAKMWAVDKQDSTAQTLLNNSWYVSPGGERFVFIFLSIVAHRNAVRDGGARGASRLVESVDVIWRVGRVRGSRLFFCMNKMVSLAVAFLLMLISAPYSGKTRAHQKGDQCTRAYSENAGCCRVFLQRVSKTAANLSRGNTCRLQYVEDSLSTIACNASTPDTLLSLCV